MCGQPGKTRAAGGRADYFEKSESGTIRIPDKIGADTLNIGPPLDASPQGSEVPNLRPAKPVTEMLVTVLDS
jgi:hypothetical protein